MAARVTLENLADYLHAHNEIDASIAEIIGRPAFSGHIGEFAAAAVFDIELHHSATNKASDGIFRSGCYASRSVNIKYYSRCTGVLDMMGTTDSTQHPDTYLVLCGSRIGAGSSRGAAAPWVVSEVFLFESDAVLTEIVSRGRTPGVATSLRKELWDEARIFPPREDSRFPLTEEQLDLIGLFMPVQVESRVDDIA